MVIRTWRRIDMEVIVARMVTDALEMLDKRACMDNAANIMGDGGGHDVVSADCIDQEGINGMGAYDRGVDDGVHAFNGSHNLERVAHIDLNGFVRLSKRDR